MVAPGSPSRTQHPRHPRADRRVAVGTQRHRAHRDERVREGAAGLTQVGMQPRVDNGGRHIVESRPEVPTDLVHLLERQRERCESSPDFERHVGRGVLRHERQAAWRCNPTRPASTLRSAPTNWLSAVTSVNAPRIESAIFSTSGVGGCGAGAGTLSAKPGVGTVCDRMCSGLRIAASGRIRRR